MIKFIKYLKQFSICQRGVAIVEFAVAAPLFVTLLIGMVEVTNYIFSFNKAEQAAVTLANIIARNKVTEAQLDNLMMAVNPLMEPFDFNEPGNGVFVTAFGVDLNTEEPEVLWARTYKTPGSGITPAQLANKITLDPDRNETIITVQVFYEFTPMMTSFLFDGGQMDVNTFSSSTPVSPNAGCPAQLLPLTNKDLDLSDKIRGMLPIQRGGSFIFSGLIWGLRALSPSWRGMWHDDNPYNLPLNFRDSKKVMVLVISGGNQWFGNETPWLQYNDRHYTSFGRWYGSAHAPLNQNVIMPSTMNAYTSEICESIKAKGIGLYTIAFSVQDQATLGLMKSCATDSNYYYEAQSSAEMKSIFKEVADQIRELRYSWPGAEGD